MFPCVLLFDSGAVVILWVVLGRFMAPAARMDCVGGKEEASSAWPASHGNSSGGGGTGNRAKGKNVSLLLEVRW